MVGEPAGAGWPVSPAVSLAAADPAVLRRSAASHAGTLPSPVARAEDARRRRIRSSHRCIRAIGAVQGSQRTDLCFPDCATNQASADNTTRAVTIASTTDRARIAIKVNPLTRQRSAPKNNHLSSCGDAPAESVANIGQRNRMAVSARTTPALKAPPGGQGSGSVAQDPNQASAAIAEQQKESAVHHVIPRLGWSVEKIGCCGIVAYADPAATPNRSANSPARDVSSQLNPSRPKWPPEAVCR